MKETVSIATFTVLNVGGATLMYFMSNYVTAIVCSFAAGILFMELLTRLENKDDDKTI